MRKQSALGITAVLAVFALAVILSQAGSKAIAADTQRSTGKATDKAMASRGMGADPNVKQGPESAKNDPAHAPAAPPKKGGAKTRGYLDCWVKADNFTPWWIKIYVDGTYRGTVSPWGDGTVNAGSGGTVIYGRADFDDGSVKTWGPRQFMCSPNGDFTWRLDP